MRCVNIIRTYANRTWSDLFVNVWFTSNDNKVFKRYSSFRLVCIINFRFLELVDSVFDFDSDVAWRIGFTVPPLIPTVLIKKSDIYTD